MRELYKGNQYRVVHSDEEYNSFITKGWSPNQEDGVVYVPYHAEDILRKVAEPVRVTPIQPPVRK